MTSAPTEIGDFRVICYTLLDRRHVPTGGTNHYVRGEQVRSFEGLAIAAYPDDDGFYLLYCDSEWKPVTDTYHESVERAKAQAEFEFKGSSATWIGPCGNRAI